MCQQGEAGVVLHGDNITGSVARVSISVAHVIKLALNVDHVYAYLRLRLSTQRETCIYTSDSHAILFVMTQPYPGFTRTIRGSKTGGSARSETTFRYTTTTDGKVGRDSLSLYTQQNHIGSLILHAGTPRRSIDKSCCYGFRILVHCIFPIFPTRHFRHLQQTPRHCYQSPRHMIAYIVARTTPVCTKENTAQHYRSYSANVLIHQSDYTEPLDL